MDIIYLGKTARIWVEDGEAGICDSNGEFQLIAPYPYDFVWMWRACCLAEALPAFDSMQMWLVMQATDRDDQEDWIRDRKQEVIDMLHGAMVLSDIMKAQVPPELTLKIIELIKAGWPINVDAAYEEVFRRRLVLPEEDRDILDHLYRFERPEAIQARYRQDVLAYLKHAKVEVGWIDHSLIDFWLIEAVKLGCENSLGVDFVLTIAIAMDNISWALSGAAFSNSPEEKSTIVKRQIKKAAKWVANHYAKPIFWFWRQPMHSPADLVDICHSVVFSFLQRREDEAKKAAQVAASASEA